MACGSISNPNCGVIGDGVECNRDDCELSRENGGVGGEWECLGEPEKLEREEVERPSLDAIEDPELQDLSRVRSGMLGLVKIVVVLLSIVVELSLRSDTLLPLESSPYIAAVFFKAVPGQRAC